MIPRITVYLGAVCWIVFSPSLFAGENASGDEQILRAAGIGVGDRSLLNFFAELTADAATLQQARIAIDQLGSDSFSVREKATSRLTALGPRVLSILQQTIRRTADLEVRRRCRDIVRQHEIQRPAALVAAAARLLGLRKPPGCAETLLAFLPGPYEESVREEIHNTLASVARDSREDRTIFVRALASAEPARRTASAVALCRLDSGDYWPYVRKLLQDPEANVRLQVARALAMAGDRRAVPVLIDLLAQLPDEQAEQAEELLYLLAGANAPLVAQGPDGTAQEKSRDAWRSWWRDCGEHVEMAALKDRDRQLGYTLLVLLHDNRIVEWDREGKTRWQLDGLAAPLDAEALPGGRVLIAEHDSNRVSERNLRGETLWEKKLTEPPIHAQRLPDGRTFIATRKQLLEVDRSGNREIVRYNSTASSIITARRFRDGRIACIEKGAYFELSAAGVEQRRFAAPPGVITTNALTLLPNGHSLIAAYGGGTVQEFNRSGKVVWEIKMSRPLCALRLPGGHTLVSSQNMVLIEFDRAGKEIARREAPGHPCQIRRR